MTEDAIEAVAKAWHDRDPTSRAEGFQRPYSLLTKEKREVLNANARAAIAAMPAPVPQQEPGEVEITDEMIRAGQQAGDKRLSEWNGRECHLDGMSTVVEYAYRAMRRAALRSTAGDE